MSDISKHLGQVSQYSSSYSPDILVRENRTPNREAHNVDPNSFVGFDVWNIYEVSFLTDKGLPVVGYGKLIYPSSNEYIVESKSLKLYFFSYNMEKMGENTDVAIDTVEQQVVIDLSALLEVPVQFKFFKAHEEVVPYKPFQLTEDSKIPCKFKDIDTIDEIENIEFNDFVENKELLKIDHFNIAPHTAITSCLLRSACRITHQPDWGDLYVYYKGGKMLDNKSLIQYIVSFRGEWHFHEEVCEMIYAALLAVLQPEELMVSCLYTRRGGLDINPIRATHSYLLDQGLIDINTVVQKTTRQ